MDKTPLNPTRHCYFSKTEDNPFLPPQYIQQLKESLDPKMALRLLYGQWVEITSEVIYHQYSEQNNYRPYSYEPDLTIPIGISWDFNISAGKPLSLCLLQVKTEMGSPTFHFFNEVVIEGASTEEACQEIADRGMFDHDTDYVVYGDATGGSRATKSKSSDYDLIKKFMANYRSRHGVLQFTMDVGLSNPPIRHRHNLVNAYCKNEAGRVRLFVYKDAPTLNKGMKLTALKKNASYIEDDSKDYQHVTTALGYAVCRYHKHLKESGNGMSSKQIR